MARQKTKDELKAELSEARRFVVRAEKERKEATELAGKLLKENQSLGDELRVSGEEKNHLRVRIEQQGRMITSRQEEMVRQETRINEMEKRLNNSWDSKQAQEVIVALLKTLVSSGVINSG